MLILRALRKTNSVISTAEVLTVLLPERDVLEIIMLIADFQLIFLFWNLFWFLTYQIVLRILFKQEVMATLHWGGPLSITQLPNVRNIVQVERNAENGGQPRPDINCKSTLREKMQS